MAAVRRREDTHESEFSAAAGGLPAVLGLGLLLRLLGLPGVLGLGALGAVLVLCLHGPSLLCIGSGDSLDRHLENYTESGKFFYLRPEPPGAPARPGQLEDQQQGEAIFEIPVAGLVVEQAHSRHAPQRSAQDGRELQGLLRDAPGVLLGPALVDTHQDKGQDVHGDEIIEEKLPEELWHKDHLV